MKYKTSIAALAVCFGLLSLVGTPMAADPPIESRGPNADGGPAMSVDPFRPTPLLEKKSCIHDMTLLAHHFPGEDRGEKINMMAVGDRRYLIQNSRILDVSDPLKPVLVSQGGWNGSHQIQVAYNDLVGKWLAIATDMGAVQRGATKPNRGNSIFDISDPRHPKVTAYFLPEQGGRDTQWEPLSGPVSETIRTVDNVFIEWDRKLIWAASDSGLYLLSAPALGEPVLRPAPVREWTLPSINQGFEKFKPAKN